MRPAEARAKDPREATTVATTTEELASAVETSADDAAIGTVRRSFRSMGTTVTVIGPAPSVPTGWTALEQAAGEVERIFVREDRRFSRFRHGTEISRVNARAGRWTRVSPPFIEVLRLSLEAAELTDGLFDPTVLPALLAAGYDRDFDEVLAGARLALNPPEPCGRWRDIEIRDLEVRFPNGAALDFGGIAKGWTVDVAARRIRRKLPWAIVDAGGDLLVVGRPPSGGLPVAIEHPEDRTRELLRLHLARGALATSSTVARSWGPGFHHLIDPRVGIPASTGVVQATAWASTCTAAEVGAKWALLGGDAALERVAAIVVRTDGSVVSSFPDDTTSPNEGER
jgi:thiamine biosynthesis lipoprotein